MISTSTLVFLVIWCFVCVIAVFLNNSFHFPYIFKSQSLALQLNSSHYDISNYKRLYRLITCIQAISTLLFIIGLIVDLWSANHDMSRMNVYTDYGLFTYKTAFFNTVYTKTHRDSLQAVGIVTLLWSLFTILVSCLILTMQLRARFFVYMVDRLKFEAPFRRLGNVQVVASFATLVVWSVGGQALTEDRSRLAISWVLVLICFLCNIVINFYYAGCDFSLIIMQQYEQVQLLAQQQQQKAREFASQHEPSQTTIPVYYDSSKPQPEKKKAPPKAEPFYVAPTVQVAKSEQGIRLQQAPLDFPSYDEEMVEVELQHIQIAKPDPTAYNASGPTQIITPIPIHAAPPNPQYENVFQSRASITNMNQSRLKSKRSSNPK